MILEPAIGSATRGGTAGTAAGLHAGPYDALPGLPFPAPRTRSRRRTSRRLPRDLRARTSSSRSGPATGSTDQPAPDGRATSSSRRRSPVRGRPGRRGDRRVPGTAHPGVRRRAEPGDPSAPLARLPGPASCGTDGASSSARATPARRSRSTSPGPATVTWLAGHDLGTCPITTSRGASAAGSISTDLVRGQPHPRRPLADRAKGARRNQRGHPVERARPKLLAAAGVERVLGRFSGVNGGGPELDDGTVMDVANVVWATGFRRDYASDRATGSPTPTGGRSRTGES